MTDCTDPDFEWPEVKNLRPAEAARLMDCIERGAAAANKHVETMRSRKAQAKQIVLAVIEDYEQPDASGFNDQGRKVRYTPYPFDQFSVDNEEAFKAWAATQSESYYDQTPRLREDIFRDEMRRRVQDGEELPPGVRRWTDMRLSRSTSTPIGRRRTD